MRPLEEQGYIIPAWNLGGTDYVACAHELARSLLAHHPGARICLLTNQTKHLDPRVFAHTRVVTDIDLSNAWANDWLVFHQTPFRETIKLEADMWVASPIDHWWTLLRHRDLVVSIGCRDWQDRGSTARNYRQTFDENHLPDVYNAMTYWRLSTTAREFFDLVRDIFAHWDDVKRLLRYPELRPSTDLVYAVAAQIMGPERVTLPFASYPRMVHMKRHHAGTFTDDWQQELVLESDPLRINTVAQWGLVHYRATR